MSDRDNTFELQQYFDTSINELKITLPNKYKSAQILLNYYLNEMIVKPEDAYNTMILIDNQIVKQVDWKTELGLTEEMYVGGELGLEKIYTWYRELQDFEDGTMLLYYNDLPRHKQKERLKNHMIEEAKKVKEFIDIELSTYNIK
ncbi:MAG: hypothetical protein COA32_17435 [Fluviicola sp.]|nr:MAG: hypothetical protein COA32_17435 [Fluviicola sp.]